MRNYRISVRFLWVLTIITGIFIFLNTHPIRPHDFWWHLAEGREIVNTHAIPLINQSSYTMLNKPYPSYQIYWLAEVGLYRMYQSGGPVLVVFASSLIITASYLLVLLLCWQVSRRWGVTAFCLLFAAAMGLNSWNVRPQLISYLAGAVFLYAIYQLRRGRNRLWLVAFPLGMLAWVNSHGSFPIGFVMLGMWFGEALWSAWKMKEKGEKMIACGLANPVLALVLTGLAALANPAGIGVISYLRNLGGNPVVQNLVPEWAPPSFGTMDGTIFLVGFLLSAALLALSPKRPDFYQLATFLVFAGLGLKTTRGVVWYGLVMAPVLADQISAFFPQPGDVSPQVQTKRRSSVANLIFLAILLLMALGSLPWFKHYLPLPTRKAGLVSSETPVQATEYLLSEHPPGRIFNEISFGSYLIWAAQPEYPVFVDPRIELYPEAVWKDYLSVVNVQPDWEERLSSYDIQILMLQPGSQTRLIATVQESSRWQKVYEDGEAVIFTKQRD